MYKIILLIISTIIIATMFGQNSNFKDLNSKEFREIIKSENGTLLDVRTPSEFANGHIPDAGQLDFYERDFNEKLLLLPKDHPIYLYCNTGYRSKIAAKTLIKNGYKDVYNLRHGIMEWNLFNFQTIVENNAIPDMENKMELDEFNALINNKKPVFIDFYAPWCAPCRSMMPMIDSLKKEYSSKIDIIKINADASKNLVKELQLNSVPHFVLYNNGIKLFEHNGSIGSSDLSSVLTNF